jgi:putative peptidoglycan lipid II flippase
MHENQTHGQAPKPVTDPMDEVAAALVRARSRALLLAMVFMLLALLASRASGLVRDALIAYQFGTTATTDSFVAAFTIPDLVSSLLLAGLVGVAAIPILIRAEGDEGRWTVANGLLNLMTAGAAACALVGMLWGRPIVSALTPGLDTDHIARAAALAQIMFPALVFFAAGSVITAVLNTGDRFTLPNLAGLFVNLAMIAAAIILGPSIGITALAWGFLTGSALQFAVQLSVAHRMGFRHKSTFGLHDPRVRAVFAAMLPFILMTAFQYGRLVIERGLGSLIAPGAISILTFANRLLLFAPSLIVAPVSTVLYPQLARDDVVDASEVKRTVASGIRLILLGAVPSALIIRYLSHPIVSLVYQRGAFNVTSSNATAYMLGLYALALIPLSLNEFISRTYFARRRHRFVLGANAVGLILTIAGDVVFTRAIGFPGLALGASVGAWGLLAIFLVGDGTWRDRTLQVLTLKTALAGIVMTVAVVAVHDVSGPLRSSGLRLAIDLIVAAAVYASMLWVLAASDVRLVGEVLIGRWGIRVPPGKVQLSVRRFAKRLLGWDRDAIREPAPGGIAGAIRATISGILVHNLMDVALRYDPIVRYLRPRLRPDDKVLEVGSGPVGIGPYLQHRVVGVDRDFTGPSSPFLERRRGDILDLGFADREFSAVLCVDVLEHLVPADRPTAVREVLRVCDNWAVLAFPSGEAAASYDRRLDSYLRERLGQSDAFLVEHLRNGLPEAETIRAFVAESLSDSGRKATIRDLSNVNLDAWLKVNRSKGSLWLRALHILAFPILFPVFRRLNSEPCYRRILFVEFVS